MELAIGEARAPQSRPPNALEQVVGLIGFPWIVANIKARSWMLCRLSCQAMRSCTVSVSSQTVRLLEADLGGANSPPRQPRSMRSEPFERSNSVHAGRGARPAGHL